MYTAKCTTRFMLQNMKCIACSVHLQGHTDNSDTELTMRDNWYVRYQLLYEFLKATIFLKYIFSIFSTG